MSNNVFKDLDLPNPEIYKLRAELAAGITEIINKRKLTQKQVAELTGVSQPDISRLVNGGIARPGLDSLLKIFLKLGRSIELVITKQEQNIPTGLYVSMA